MSRLTHHKNLLLLALAVALVLLLPWIAMQFTAQVAWSPFDFALAGALLFGAGLAFEHFARRAGTTTSRAAAAVTLTAALLLVWINLAVGILGSEDNPANRLYLGVLAVLFLGALLVRFRPLGMSRVLLATALAQVLVTGVGLLLWQPDVASPAALLGVLKALGVNAFFVVLWVGAAWLFRRAYASQDR